MYGTQTCPGGATNGPLVNLAIIFDYHVSCAAAPAAVVTQRYAAANLLVTMTAPYAGSHSTGWINPLTGENLLEMCNTANTYYAGGSNSQLTMELPSYWDNAQRTCY